MRLSTPLQVEHFKRMFMELNPLSDPSLVDFKAVVDETLTFSENLDALISQYPSYAWKKSDDYASYHRAQLNQEAANYGMELVNSRTLAKLRKKAEEKEKQGSAPPTRLSDEVTQAKKVRGLTKDNDELLDQVIDEMSLRPLLVVGTSRAGKTVMVKALVQRLRERGVRQIMVFDPSLAWFTDAPLKYRRVCRVASDKDFRAAAIYNCVYDVSKIIGDDRGNAIKDVVEREYESRVDRRRVSGDAPTSFPFNVTVLEEAQTLFRKFGMYGTRIYDWVSMGLNFNMSGVYTTQRPAEVPTEIIERCNLLVGYVDGHRNMEKLRGATNPDFMATVKTIKQGSHEFAYYDGGRGFKVKAKHAEYGEPKTVEDYRAPPVNIGDGDKPKTSGISGWWWVPVYLVLAGILWVAFTH